MSHGNGIISMTLTVVVAPSQPFPGIHFIFQGFPTVMCSNLKGLKTGDMTIHFPPFNVAIA